MKEINIGKKIIEKRKEKGITQDELAVYMGVSKASVSKWETCQSYPDITFLPELATYFNISVDELIGYSPQMTKEDIRKLYHHLCAEFSCKPFEEVMDKCHELIKKYYSCFPLLLQMVVLIMNHYMVANTEKQQEIVKEAIDLCLRIKEESNDVWLIKQANSIEASCYLILQRPVDVLEILDGIMKPDTFDEFLLANAYQMTGNTQKTKEILQVSMYKYILGVVGNAILLILQYADDTKKFEQLKERILAIGDLFKLNKLHPNSMLQFYLAVAQGYAIQGNKEKVVDMLKIYADICTTDFFPYELHGDDFFDSIGNWFKEFDLDIKAPRGEKFIKDSMIQALTSNPMFASLYEEPTFKSIINNLKEKLGGN
jgi:transcriptional regulator with XRE-family HTH domain